MVAVQGVHGVQHDAGRTGAGECGGDFLADVARFADSDHDDFAALAKRADHQVHRAVERRVELRAHGFEAGQLDVEDLARPFQVAHAPERLPARVATFNGETRCYSVFGYEPSTLTKLHCCSSSAMALATLWSLTWPSQSMKKKYSHALRLLGRDSIFVMFNR